MWRCHVISFMYIYCSDVRSHSATPESNKQNPRDRTLDLSIFFRYKNIPFLKNLPLPAPNESLPYWFQGNFAASFVFNFCLMEFLLSAFANRFELRCEPKRLMLLYYKICPCLHLNIFAKFRKPNEMLDGMLEPGVSSYHPDDFGSDQEGYPDPILLPC